MLCVKFVTSPGSLYLSENKYIVYKESILWNLRESYISHKGVKLLKFLVYSFQSKWLKFWHDGRIKRFLSNIPFYCTNVFSK